MARGKLFEKPLARVREIRETKKVREEKKAIRGACSFAQRHKITWKKVGTQDTIATSKEVKTRHEAGCGGEVHLVTSVTGKPIIICDAHTKDFNFFKSMLEGNR